MVTSELRNAIAQALIQAPAFSDINGLRGLVLASGLEESMKQVELRGPSRDTISRIVDLLADRGRLPTGRYALELLLEAAKQFVEEPQSEVFDSLLRQLREGYSPSYLRASRLSNRLNQEQQVRLKLIERQVSRLARTTSDVIDSYSYTDHYLEHAENLNTIVNSLIPDDAVQKFNSMEVFVLYCSVLLHDIGVLSAAGKDAKPEVIRRKHHLLASTYVRTHREQLGLDSDETESIASLCYAHNRSDLTQLARIVPVAVWQVRLRFLAALLRLAEVVDGGWLPAMLYTVSSGKSHPIRQVKHTWRTYRSVSYLQFKPDEATIVLEVTSDPDTDLEQSCRLAQLRASEISKCLTSLSSELEPNGVVYRKVDVVQEAVIKSSNQAGTSEVHNAQS